MTDTLGRITPIISVKEARKLLGDTAKNMTDDEVTKLIDEVDELAKIALDQVKKNKINVGGTDGS